MKKSPKYEGINPLTKLHPGEPYFFLRAQDVLAEEIVAAYSHRLQREADKALASGNEELSDRLMQDAIQVIGIAHKFLDWQQDNPDKVKLPD